MKNCFFILFIMIVWGSAKAQPFNMNPNIEPYEIKLQPYTPQPGQSELAKGKMGYLQINQDKDTAFYFVQGLSIYSPIFVDVSTDEASNPLRVQLHKINWEHALKTGNTDSKGDWHADFKTEGDFGIMVIPKTLPAEYKLMVWAGDEADLELPTVFRTGDGDAVTEGNDKPQGKSEGSPLLYLIIGFLLAVVGFLGYKVLKKNKSSN